MTHLSARHDVKGVRPSLPPPVKSNAPVRSATRREDNVIGKYRVTKTLGKGNFARVKLARHIPTGREVAIKIVDKTQLGASSLQKMLREVRIMKTLDHPNIVKLIEVLETDRHLYMVLEYASGGELFDYIVKHGKLKEQEARAKFRQVLSAVEYLHQKRLVHRDLKAENLLLDGDLNIKLADFGFSNEFSIGRKLDTFCGSPPYAAPELFQGKKYDGPEVDVWSVGVILYILICGCLPFDGQNLKELREKVLRGKYRVPFYMSTDCENLLKKFLVINPSKRSTLQAAMKEKWINMDCEEMKPYVEPKKDAADSARIETLVNMGYSKKDVEESLRQNKFDEIMGTFTLLGRRPSLLSPPSYSAELKKAPMSTFSEFIEQSSSIPKESSHLLPSNITKNSPLAVVEELPVMTPDSDYPSPSTPSKDKMAVANCLPPDDMVVVRDEQSVTFTLSEETETAVTVPTKAKRKKKKAKNSASEDGGQEPQDDAEFVNTDELLTKESPTLLTPSSRDDLPSAILKTPESNASQDLLPSASKVGRKASRIKTKSSKQAPEDTNISEEAINVKTTTRRQVSDEAKEKPKKSSKPHVQRHATVGSGDNRHQIKPPTNAANHDGLLTNQKDSSKANQKLSSASSQEKTLAEAGAVSSKHHETVTASSVATAAAVDNPNFPRNVPGRSTFHSGAPPASSRPVTAYTSQDSNSGHARPTLLGKFMSKFQKKSSPTKESDELSPVETVKPRSIPALSADVTTNQDPEYILTELSRALTASQYRYEAPNHKYTLLCSYGDQKLSFVQWEAEICRLPLRSLNGIRYKKLAGNSAQFKAVLTRLSGEIKL